MSASNPPSSGVTGNPSGPAPILRAQVQGVLRRHSELRLALLFGSQAHGTARTDSDVDLAVAAGHPLQAAELIMLIGELGAATGRPVDLIDLAAAGEPLLGQILTQGVRLLGDSAQQAAWLTRHLIEVADFVPLQQRILNERRRRWIGS